MSNENKKALGLKKFRNYWIKQNPTLMFEVGIPKDFNTLTRTVKLPLRERERERETVLLNCARVTGRIIVI